MIEQRFTADHGLAEWGIILIVPLFMLRQMKSRVVPSIIYPGTNWDEESVSYFKADNMLGEPRQLEQ